MNNGLRYTCRIKLSDFIDTDYEESIIYAIQQISKTLGSKIFFKFWYETDELTTLQIESFVRRYEVILKEVGTHIHNGSTETWMNKSWFNIRSETYKESNDYRYERTYKIPSEIIVGLLQFADTVKRTVATQQEPIVKETPKQTQKSYTRRIVIKRKD